MYQYLVDPWIATVFMDSTDTLTEGTPSSMYQYLVHPWIAIVSMDSMDTVWIL